MDEQTAQPVVDPQVAAGMDKAADQFNELLETNVLLYIQDNFGVAVAEEYLVVREKNDLAEILLFEAQYGFNLDGLFQSEAVKIMAELESTQAVKESNE